MATMQDTSSTSGRVIAADNVQGTGVYDRAGNKLGSVEDIMIDKISGGVCYAVLNFGGFLGMGTKEYPLPVYTEGAMEDSDWRAVDTHYNTRTL